MNKLSRNLLLVIISFLNVFLVSCKEKVYKVVLDKKNPVEFIFSTSKESLYSIIDEDRLFRDMSILTIKNRLIIPPEILEMFLKPNNNRDIFLTTWSDIGKSKIYKNKDGIYFDYNVSFYLHLERIDDTHTKVSITAIKPKIVVGREFLPSLPHMVRRNKTIDIEPSTIEEYEILLEIGDFLHERNMPDILLPNEKSKIEIIKQSKTKK